MFEQFHKLYTFSCIGCASVQSGAFWIICQLYPPARVAWNHGISHPSDWQVSINPISIFEEYFIGYVWRWHLGYCHEDYLPTSRGFHTFNGFLNGWNDYYLHTSQGQNTACCKKYFFSIMMLENCSWRFSRGLWFLQWQRSWSPS